MKVKVITYETTYEMYIEGDLAYTGDIDEWNNAVADKWILDFLINAIAVNYKVKKELESLDIWG